MMSAKRTKKAKDATIDAVAELEEENDVAPSVLRKGFANIEAIMRKHAVGQDDIIRCLILSVLAREHTILVGPWGCNKTALINMLTTLIGADESTFYATLDKFTPPEVLLGMFSPRALKEDDKWLRNTTNKLPEATFAFIGEVFRGNSAVRASLHTIINERYFENDGKRIAVPLKSMFCDSNSYPYRDEDRPFYDRLLLRADVKYIGADRGYFSKMMHGAPFDAATAKQQLTFRQTVESIRQVGLVAVPSSVTAALFEVRTVLLTEGITLSDRRWKRSLNVLKAAAWLNGTNSVTFKNFGVLQFVLWDSPEQIEKVTATLDGYTSMAVTETDAELVKAAKGIYDNITTESSEDDMSAAFVTLSDIQDKLVDDSKREEVQDFLLAVEGNLVGSPTATPISVVPDESTDVLDADFDVIDSNGAEFVYDDA